MYRSEKMDGEIRLLGRLLGEVIREQEGLAAYELEEEIRLGARARRAGEPGAEERLVARIRSLDGRAARTVGRAFTIFFDLANLTEDRQRVRVLRERERARFPEPRSESVADVVDRLRGAGLGAAAVQELLDGLILEPVFTAHPTEARRPTTRAQVRRLRECVAAMDREDLLPREREHQLSRLRSHLTAIWQSDLLRPRPPTVQEEVEAGLFFAPTLWEVVPLLFRDLRGALEGAWPQAAFRLPAFLRFGSWIGGDRDGNPNVTARVTEWTFRRLRRAAVEAHLAQCRLLSGSLVSSEHQVPVEPALKEGLERDLARWPRARAAVEEIFPREVYRRCLRLVEWRLERTLEEASRRGGVARRPRRRLPPRRGAAGRPGAPRRQPARQPGPAPAGRGAAGLAVADAGVRAAPGGPGRAPARRLERGGAGRAAAAAGAAAPGAKAGGSCRRRRGGSCWGARWPGAAAPSAGGPPGGRRRAGCPGRRGRPWPCSPCCGGCSRPTARRRWAGT